MFSPAKIALLALLTACGVGAVPGDATPDGPRTPDGAPSPNEATFNAQIKPLVTECTACHGGTPPNLTSYGMLIDKYKMKPGAQNILVTKGDATAGVHQGLPYFTPAEKTQVAAWIDGLQ